MYSTVIQYFYRLYSTKSYYKWISLVVQWLRLYASQCRRHEFDHCYGTKIPHAMSTTKKKKKKCFYNIMTIIPCAVQLIPVAYLPF